MKNLLKSALFVMLVSSIVFSSCSKEEIKTENTKEELKADISLGLKDVEVQKGMLVFKNEEHFSNVKKELNTMPEADLQEWENNIGFVSMYRIFENIKQSEIDLENYYETLSDEEIEKLKATGEIYESSDLTKKYLKSGFLKVYNKGTDYEYTDITCFAKILDKVLNEKGLVKVGNEIQQYTEKYYKVITDGDFDKIELLNELKSSTKSIFVTSPFNLNNSKADPDKSWGDEASTHKDKMIKAQVRFMQYYTNSDSTIFRTYFWADIQLLEHRWGKWRLTDGTALLRGYYNFNEGNGDIPSYINKDLYGESTYRHVYIDKTTSVSSYTQALEVTYVNLQYLRYGGTSGIKLYLNSDDNFAPTGHLF